MLKYLLLLATIVSFNSVFMLNVQAQSLLPDAQSGRGVAAEAPDPDAPFSYDLDEIVAKGNGLTVKGSDVKDVREFFQALTPFVTTDEQYLRYALKLRLFALEADKMGLIDLYERDLGNVSLPELMKFRDKYVGYFLEDLVPDDKVIESYYHAFPGKFLKEELKADTEAAAEKPEREFTLRPIISQDQLIPLNDILRKQIRTMIVQPKRGPLVREKYEELMEKYNVTIY